MAGKSLFWLASALAAILTLSSANVLALNFNRGSAVGRSSSSYSMFSPPLLNTNEPFNPQADIDNSPIQTDDLSSPEPRIPRNPNKDRHRSVFDFLANDHRFTRLVEVVEQAGSGFQDDLQDPKEHRTVFAPTNEAFHSLSRLIQGRENSGRNHKHGLAAEPQVLAQLLRYHIIPDKEVHRHEFKDGVLLSSALEPHHESNRRQLIRVSNNDGKIYLNMYARVEDSDIRCANGVVHAISDVLIPPEDAFTAVTMLPSKFSIQALALHLTGLNKRVAEAKQITGFIPSNKAWERIGFAELARLFHPENRHQLRQILESHYSDEVVTSHQVQKHQNQAKELHGDDNPHRNALHIKSWSGERIQLEAAQLDRYGQEQHVLMVDHVPCSISDVPVKNGIIHGLNAVINSKAFKHEHRHEDKDSMEENSDEDDMDYDSNHGRRHGRGNNHNNFDTNGDDDDEQGGAHHSWGEWLRSRRHLLVGV